MFTLNCKGRLLVIDKPIVMGIINITPDSFYEGSRQQDTDAVLQQAELMLKQGATILDIGAQSTRPGSLQVSEEMELKRLIDILAVVHERFPEAFISVDTYYSRVAKEAVHAGASIINDISAGTLDPQLLPVVASLDVPYVLMHMKGNPQNMQQSPEYGNVVSEVLDFISKKLKQVLDSGIKDVIIDPGFGFGKTIEHNFELLRKLEVFQIIPNPLLVGISRKSTISRTLGVTANESLNGTTVLNTIGLMKGANILRVHDVKEAVEAVKLYNALWNKK